MMKLLARFPVIAIPVLVSVALLSSHAVTANTLYQWTGTDGTPTYSPEPPPKGIAYTIVGADLKPMPEQPQAPAAKQIPQSAGTVTRQEVPLGPQALPTAPLVAKRKSDIVMTPAPGNAAPAKAATATVKPKNAWKPVKYADDPNPDAARPNFSGSSVSASIATPINTISNECLTVKQKLMALEDQFANAQTAKAMDAAVLRLSTYRKETQGICGKL